ncbi:FkbM family methyltransferase [Nitrospirillum amazonense]|uniref:FkbM family methyltransferase n=1 Tax=Nitrospirillum amazonense TaxID=28077 RepID=A0A560J9J1_9PROT|nr:FkbM family methyltransferase [Nitrospirillum amazonense]MDG3442696.1 FkbM family methyltransferase [Nitrospirillum amazonense]TWB67861.1 FkbM family methyltransferase [Nitrospirillum amazonense]
MVSYSIILPTIYGDLIVNRHDINQTNALLKTGAAHDAEKIAFAQNILRHAPKPATFLDIGGNFGVYGIGCAPILADGGGQVHIFEAQKVLAYMICGSLALNSIENATVHHVCVGDTVTEVEIPGFDYHREMNFGSVEFGNVQRERLHQDRQPAREMVKQVRIDDFGFDHVRFIKVDVEGMEMNVLNGAQKTIEKCRPICQVEYLKSDVGAIHRFFTERGYKLAQWKEDALCIPEEEAATLLPPELR